MEKGHTKDKSKKPSNTILQQHNEESKNLGKPSKARGKCTTTESSSHTKFYRKPRHENDFKEITREQYCHVSESISSSDTFNCVHGPQGKVYTEEGLLKRNILKELDPIPIDPRWNDECPPAYGWEMAEKIEFLVVDGCALQQLNRLQAHIRDLARTSNNGFRVDTLKSLTVIMEFLLETIPKISILKEELKLLLINLTKPIILTTASDTVKYFDVIRHFLGFLGYLLMIVDEDDLFDLISKAIIWHLSAPDSVRKQGLAVLPLQPTLTAASILTEVTVRMLAIASPHRFPTFLNIALLLAFDTEKNCIDMMKENIIENIFCRFNPYFPERPLPFYDLDPVDCQDPNVKLGDSSVHLYTTMSLLLVLLKTTKNYLLKDPQNSTILPCPNAYSLRCFIWVYHYECRAREHRHERITLTVIATALLKCFGPRLSAFSSSLMPDIMSLSVLTELPPRNDWTSTVNFNIMQEDVLFKKILIHFVVDALKVFPYNKFMVKSRYWLLGLMYLIDPGLSCLRARWSASLFSELRKTALQALVCSLPLCDPNLVKEYCLIRRLMWYIEWYSENPYEIPTLYWCLRVLQTTVYHRSTVTHESSVRDLFDTHGVIIIINLCYTLMNQKMPPPVEKSQVVISLCLRLLTNTVHSETQYYLTCCVYTTIKWPNSINSLTRKMLNMILYSLEKHYLISDRWMVSLLNFIWEAIIWTKEYRELFVKNDGVYKLLDLITMTRPAVQCIALALICDILRAGIAVGHLVTWRACPAASTANPVLVKRGATIATLLAAIFRDECKLSGIPLNEYGISENAEYPIMTTTMFNALYNQDLHYMKSPRTSKCIIASDMAGSRMSKAFALLHMLSVDLEDKVAIADDAYKLYKNINLSIEDETVLILCSHYLTLKLADVWMEIKLQSSELVYQDNITVEEFTNISKGWAREIRQQQEDAVKREQKKELDEESSLYAFLGRIRLNIALDALKHVRCAARSTDRHRIFHSMLHDAVFAHHRRSAFVKRLDAPVLRTYMPPLDDANITGQSVKVHSIQVKQQPQIFSSSSTSQ